MRHFRYIDPLGKARKSTNHKLGYINLEDDRIGKDGALLDTLVDFNYLAEESMHAYRGVFPEETPYLLWRALDDLPWSNQYQKRRIPKAEIEHIADLICGDEYFPSTLPAPEAWLPLARDTQATASKGGTYCNLTLSLSVHRRQSVLFLRDTEHRCKR